MQCWLFYYHHLERVSRSFSFCIAQLVSPQREYISLSYLLFRIADTIEDSKWLERDIQFQQFDLLKQALDLPANISSLIGWQKKFPNEISDGEKLLISQAHLLLEDFFVLPKYEQCQLKKH